MHGFVRDGAVYRARLAGPERLGFARVVADVAELLAAEGGRERPGRTSPRQDDPIDRLLMSAHDVPPPDDPAVRRLLPDASRDDGDLAAEFRRLTEDELRTTKVGRLRRLLCALTSAGAEPDSPSDLVVPLEEADAMAAALTDVRLVLADRLGLVTDEDVDTLETRLYQFMAAQDPTAQDDDPAGVGSDTADQDDPEQRGATGEEVWMFLGTIYTALTWLQDSLVEVMLEDL